MRAVKAYRLEKKYEEYGVLGIESSEDNLMYFVDKYRRGIAIAGQKGMTVLTVSQAEAVADELQGIVENMALRA